MNLLKCGPDAQSRRMWWKKKTVLETGVGGGEVEGRVRANHHTV